MIGHMFTDHPDQVGETYLEHQRYAAGIGLTLLGAGCAAIIHGLIPCLFVTAAGDTIRRLERSLGARQIPRPGLAQEPG